MDSASSKASNDAHDEKDSDSDDDDDQGNSTGMISMLQELFAKQLKLGPKKETSSEKLLNDVSFDGIVEYIKSEKCKNIIVMAGAGISTSAGIPDFRSPGSGLYDNLQKYNLPSPECIFDINFFKNNPEPFYHLAKELFPGSFKPTPCHHFLKLLHEKGLLLRLYTQNIDTMERIVGIPGDKLIEAHGTFFTSRCIARKCKKEYSLKWMKERIFKDEIPHCENCKSLVKPDIIFFGECLPERFFRMSKEDFPNCDLLIIVGTSLSVQPFAGLVDNVSPSTPRLLINKEKCGQGSHLNRFTGYSDGLDFDSDRNFRDVAWLGLCDDGCQSLADSLGWGDELKSMVENFIVENDECETKISPKEEIEEVKEKNDEECETKINPKEMIEEIKEKNDGE